MSSSESNFAWRAAQFYGPDVVQRSRPERIEWLRGRIAAQEGLGRDEYAAHRAICMVCQNGDPFCLQALSTTPAQIEHSKKISFMRSLIHSEEKDEAYAQAVRGNLYGVSGRRVEYRDHVDGFCAYWQNVRHRKFASVDWKCEQCGRAGALDAHHLHYDTLGFEDLHDLQALCRGCHENADRVRAADTRYNNAWNTYMRKKYGDDYWMNDHDNDGFGEWLESKQEKDAW
jgi:hypothetical protein